MRTKTKAFFVGLLAFFLVFLGCSTTSAFNGPVSDKPTVSVSYFRHYETTDPRLPPHLERITVANVTNPSTRPMTLTLDCTESRHTLEVPARTTSHVLLDPKDASCSLE